MFSGCSWNSMGCWIPRGARRVSASTAPVNPVPTLLPKARRERASSSKVASMKLSKSLLSAPTFFNEFGRVAQN
jgi:hypothetical protein